MTYRCASCGAARDFDRLTMQFSCRYCGTHEPAPPALAAFEVAQETTLVCPSCRGALHEGTAAGWPLHICVSCYGTLVRMADFMAVTDAVRVDAGPPVAALPPRRQNPGDRTLTCPLCGRSMLSHLYAGAGNIVLDTCEPCGVNWLDAGELRRVALSPGGARQR